MANHKSAKKRAIQSEKKRMRNVIVKTKVKGAVKAVRTLNAENAGDSQQILTRAQSVIAVAAKKGVLHKRTASRKISRLSKLVNSMSA